MESGTAAPKMLKYKNAAIATQVMEMIMIINRVEDFIKNVICG